MSIAPRFVGGQAYRLPDPLDSLEQYQRHENLDLAALAEEDLHAERQALRGVLPAATGFDRQWVLRRLEAIRAHLDRRKGQAVP